MAINLPADLPENWTANQIISHDGVSAGLTEQHSYNYLNKQVNAAQKAVNSLNEDLEEVYTKISNFNNILLNPIVPNQIINQRAASSYSTVNQYTIDRWKLISGTLSVNAGTGSIGIPESITLNGTIRQIIEFPQSYAGKTLTASVVGGTISINGSEFSGKVTVTLPSTLTSLYADIKAGNSSPKQTQLIFGESAPLFNPRSFAEELALCQRYYEKSYSLNVAPGTASTTGRVLAVASIAEYGGRLMLGNFRTSKRVAPTMTMYSPASGASGAISVIAPAEVITGVATQLASEFSPGSLSSPSLTVGKVYQWHWTADAEL